MSTAKVTVLMQQHTTFLATLSQSNKKEVLNMSVFQKQHHTNPLPHQHKYLSRILINQLELLLIKMNTN